MAAPEELPSLRGGDDGLQNPVHWIVERMQVDAWENRRFPAKEGVWGSRAALSRVNEVNLARDIVMELDGILEPKQEHRRVRSARFGPHGRWQCRNQV